MNDYAYLLPCRGGCVVGQWHAYRAYRARCTTMRACCRVAVVVAVSLGSGTQHYGRQALPENPRAREAGRRQDTVPLGYGAACATWLSQIGPKALERWTEC